MENLGTHVTMTIGSFSIPDSKFQWLILPINKTQEDHKIFLTKNIIKLELHIWYLLGQASLNTNCVLNLSFSMNNSLCPIEKYIHLTIPILLLDGLNDISCCYLQENIITDYAHTIKSITVSATVQNFSLSRKKRLEGVVNCLAYKPYEFCMRLLIIGYVIFLFFFLDLFFSS